jgi:hypothetical protein
MARRPIKDKQYARLRKAINRLLLEGKVKLESHVVGRERVSRIVAGQTVEQWEPVTRIPGHLRDLNQRLQVIT